jgi:site-specific recombinase XerC
VDTGLRPGEFCALNIEDLPVSHGRKTLLVRDSTGAVAREVEISTKATELIARFTALYRVDAKPQDPFLASERGNRFTYRSLYNKIRKIGIEAGIGPFHPHMLRSTFIVNRFNETQDLRLVQKEVGHASAKTTALYTQKNHNVRCDACDSLLGGQERKIESGQILCKNCLKYFQ